MFSWPVLSRSALKLCSSQFACTPLEESESLFSLFYVSIPLLPQEGTPDQSTILISSLSLLSFLYINMLKYKNIKLLKKRPWLHTTVSETPAQLLACFYTWWLVNQVCLALAHKNTSWLHTLDIKINLFLENSD